MTMERDAFITGDGLYRYRLMRKWGEGYMALWIMLNPSTADAEKDDPTIRRCLGFTKSWIGFGSLEVVNLFAYRSTKASVLLDVDDPIGPDNDRYILEAASRATVIIAAWGSRSLAIDPSRAQQVRVLLKHHPLDCLGVTKRCSPRHPLYVSGRAQRRNWSEVLC